MKNAPNSKRAHDLVDLQLILSRALVDWSKTAEACRRLFAYRKCQPWPPTVVKGESWGAVYESQKGDLPVLPTVDEAVAWANALISKISRAWPRDSPPP